MRSRPLVSALLVLSLLGTSCAQSPSKAPESATSAREPTSLADAQAQLDAALHELGVEGTREKRSPATGDATTAPKPEATPARGARPTEPAPVAPAAPVAPMPLPMPQGGVKKSEASAADERPEGPCARACRAYSSLRRAVDAVCRLAGDPSDPCTAAQGRQREADARVASCGCSR